MATNGAMSIAGGNWQIFDRMLKSSPCISTHFNTGITHVSKQADNTYNLTTSSGEIVQYDEVVLASPLQFSELIIDPPPKHTPDQIPYVKLYTTLFASPHKPRPAAFHLPDDQLVPHHVLTTLHPNNPAHQNATDPKSGPGFNSISVVAHGINRHISPPRAEYIYKVFALTPIVDAGFLSHLLGATVTDAEAEHGDVNGTISWIHHKLWHSYPEERPRVTFDEIKLDEGLWYTSGIEPFISTMETSALMGKNVARLVVDGWLKNGGGEDLGVKSGEDWRFVGVKGEEQRPLKANL
jgi:prenylcysteine oxidase/farnesylcysteine lyase